MDALELLTDADLTALASALRAGRLAPPFTAVGVRRFCAGEHAGAAAARLQELADDGMGPRHLAVLAEPILRVRFHRPVPADVADLVWTGPEAPGLANRDTGVVVRELFGSAENEVSVAGFAVYQGRVVFKRLAERMAEKPGLRTRLFLDVHRNPGDASTPADIVRRFADHFRSVEWPGENLPEIFHDPRSLDPTPGKRACLHAKCVVVDRRVALVTSANFTEAAQSRNIEVGALVRCDHFAARLADHFNRLVECGLVESIGG